MQPLNNDIDNLMRQAAAAYEVQPAGADWQKVADVLDREEGVTQQNSAWQHSLRYGLLLLFLLTSLVCNKYLFAPFDRLGNRLKSEPSLAVRNANTIEGYVKPTAGSNENPGSLIAEKKNARATEAITQNVVEPFYYHPASEAEHTKAGAINELVETNDTFSSRALSGLDKSSEPDRPDIENIKTSLIPFVNAEPLLQGDAMADKGQAATERKTRRFYLGVVAGPDISTVQFKESGDVGITAGVVAGYSLTPKWDIETGLLWNKKNYYTDGKHFKTDELNLPSHTKILSAEGYCQMFEIPVNIRYRFAQGKKHHWFAAAGASSYLMQKEDYSYLYERYNVRYYSNKSYTAASRNWFSVANISIGYAVEKRNGMQLRIEPYIKLPLGGLGIGSLPITSTGLQVGITYPVR